MSEPIPESIPTSADPRSRRPLKKARPANTTPSGQALSAQSSAVSALFANPDRPVHIASSNGDGNARGGRGGMAPPPEIVANVQGSSAGAGSGEFHVYKASRRREYERVKVMEEEKVREERDREFESKREEVARRDEEAARRRREKRLKRRGRAKGGVAGGENGVAAAAAAGIGKVGLAAGRVALNEDDDDGSGRLGVGDGTLPVAAEEVGIVIHDDDD